MSRRPEGGPRFRQAGPRELSLLHLGQRAIALRRGRAFASAFGYAQAAAPYVTCYIVCSSWVPIIDVGKRSAEYNSTGDFVSLRHQCAVALVSVVTSPGLWTIGTEQLLAYSMMVPFVMTMIAGRSW